MGIHAGVVHKIAHRKAVAMKSNVTVTNGPSVAHRWTRSPRTVGKARAELLEVLTGWNLCAIEDEALVVPSELVTNAVRHARTSPGRQIETRYLREADGIRIEVHGPDTQRPTARVPGESGGYGLVLVDGLADRWGVEELDGAGKPVWAVVTLPHAY
ncbi:ATP-binding protein [Streptomyces sp. NPDC051018]|uniref:ATP-binding protein n=1 Tax=Streptomyces sp. NPDC051018 TaxID=3365639 RepID=UPI00378B06AB